MRKLTLLAGLVFLFGQVLVPNSKASEFDKKTILTFSEPVQIPGAILGAGTYVVERAVPGGNPDIVRFLSSDERHIYATVLTIPTERGTPPNKPEVTFAETPSGTPQAVKKWWYPGETTGEEFIYPKGAPVLTARATGLETRSSQPPPESVKPAAPPASEPEPSSTPNQPAEEQPLSSSEVQTAEVTNPPPEPAPSQTATTPPATSTTPQTQELPKTASNLPLLVILGTAMFLGGIGWKAFSGEGT